LILTLNRDHGGHSRRGGAVDKVVRELFGFCNSDAFGSKSHYLGSKLRLYMILHILYFLYISNFKTYNILKKNQKVTRSERGQKSAKKVSRIFLIIEVPLEAIYYFELSLKM